MPFLGPAVAVWITFSIAVMAYYYLFIARPRPDHPAYEAEVPEVPEVPEVLEVLDERPRWESRWGDASASGLARPQPIGSLQRTELPAYDMDDYPTQSWTASS
jgi:hypothetical protein